MPHPSAITDPIIGAALTTMTAPVFRPRILFSGYVKLKTGQDAGGNPIFAATHSWVDDFDLSLRSDGSAPVTISLTKPVIPNLGEAITASEISISILNPDQHLATTQSGAIFDPYSIEAGRIIVEAIIEGLPDLPSGDPRTLPMYRGRIVGKPVEEFGKTTFTIRDIAWDLVKTPVLFENIGITSAIALNGQVQDSFVYQGILQNNSVTINNASGSGKITLYDGYVAYNEEGNLLTTIKNNKPDDIDLINLTILTGAKPGKYEINFISPSKFTVTYPDSSIFSGSIQSNFISPKIEILASYWLGTNGTDCKIEFYVRWTAEGNPGTLIKHILQRGFLQLWGGIPWLQSAPPAMPVKWTAFDEIEKQFESFTVFVSETNQSNEVWEERSGARPLNCLQLAQRVADHIGAVILFDEEGELTIRSPFIYDEPIYQITDSEAIITNGSGVPSLRIVPQDQYNYIRFQYARNDQGNSYGLEYTPLDIRINSGIDVSEFVISLPYYKAGVSENKVRALVQIYYNKYFSSQNFVELSVNSSHGLIAQPGDRFYVKTTVKPIIEGYYEVISVNKTVGNNQASLTLVQIQTPEGAASLVCEYKLCNPLV